MKRFFLIIQTIFIIFTRSCEKNSIESIIPSDDIIISDNDTVTEEEILKIDLTNKIFLNVINDTTLLIPKIVHNYEINWEYDSDYLSYDGSMMKPKKDGKTKLIANINNQNIHFFVEIENLSFIKTVQYGLNFHYMFISDKKKMSGDMDPKQIVLHNTANTAPAINEIKWLGNKDNTSSTSFHFAVDDTGVYQAIPTEIIAHHAGVRVINYQSIGVEIAKSMITDEKIKDEAIMKGAQLIALLMSYYQLDIKDVITHYEASGKYCPHDVFDRFDINKFYAIL